jgi:hypothetical protein
MDHLVAENSGHVSGTMKHSQYECAVVERLEDDQVISVCADPYRVAQVRTRRVVIQSARNLNFGLWCEVRAHSLRTVFGQFGVLALQTI